MRHKIVQNIIYCAHRVSTWISIFVTAVELCDLFGVVVRALVTSTKLSYVELG